MRLIIQRSERTQQETLKALDNFQATVQWPRRLGNIITKTYFQDRYSAKPGSSMRSFAKEIPSVIVVLTWALTLNKHTNHKQNMFRAH